LFLAFTVGRSSPIEYFTPVLLAQTIFWAASSIGPVSIPIERRVRTFDRYLSAPISLISVLFGKTLAGVIYGVLVSIPALIVGIIFFQPMITNGPLLGVGIVLMGFVFASMGIMFASIPTENVGDVMMPLNFIRIPLMFISGLFIPIEQLPPIGQAIAFASPLTHALNLFRFSMGVTYYYDILVSIGILVLYIALFTGLGIQFHKKIMEKQ